MTSRKKQQEQSSRYLTTGIVVSISLFVLFLLLQQNNSKLLSLEIKWLVVASIPLTIAILRSNMIQKFKGFGIELETRLQEPVGRMNLTATNALIDLPGDEKQSMMYLQHLQHAERMRVQRLTVREGRRVYDPTAIRTYLQRLPNLKYFEVLSSEGKFVALVPVELFKRGEDVDPARLDSFVIHIVEKDTTKFLPDVIITDSVLETENLVNALPVVRKSKYGLLPVISESGNLLGVVTRELIESRIADEVIATQRSE